MDRRTADERELQFDVRQLDDGDVVEVFIDAEARWRRGAFVIATTGEALVRFGDADAIALATALRLGLRRVLH